MPVTALHSLLHLILGAAHASLDAVLQAGAVADDDGGAGIGFRLTDGLEGLGLIVAHGHLGHVDVAVAHGDGAQVLLLDLLAAGGELGHRSGGRGLGGLSAGVGVHLGIHDQHIDVPVLGQHVIDAAEADVIGPAVTAEGPHGLLGEIFLVLEDKSGLIARLGLLQSGHQGVRYLAGLGGVAPVGKVILHSLLGDALFLQSLQAQFHLAVDGAMGTQEAIGELGVVLKQGLLPGGAVAAGVAAIRRHGHGAAVGGGAAGGVGHVHPVAEQLGHQLDIGRLGAAGAGGGELEVGLGELGGLDALVADDVLLQQRLVHGVVVEVGLLILLGLEGDHFQGTLGRAGGQAHTAAHAVVGRDLHPEGVSGGILAQALGRNGHKVGRGTGLFLIRQQHGADGCVGAGHGAAVALDAGVGIPLGNRHRHAALGVGGGAVFPSAVQAVVLFEDGHRQLVAMLTVHGYHDLLDEGCSLQLLRRAVLGVGPAVRDLHLGHACQARVHGGVVQVHDLLAALLEVGVIVALLHLLHRHVDGDHLGQLEERCLQNGIDAAAKAQLPGDLGGIHNVELRVLVGQIPLHLGRQTAVQFLCAPGAVEQVGAAVLQIGGGVVFIHIGGGVDTHEIRRGHQVCRPDGLVAEAQMALGQAAGLHGIVGEVRLGILVGSQADGGDGVLVGAHGAVAAQAPDLAGHLAGMGHLHLCIGQGGEGHVVLDADGEAVLGLILVQVVIDRHDLAGGGVLGGQAVPAAHHDDVLAAGLLKGALHVQEQRLAHGAGFLGPVQHGDLLAGGRDGSGEVAHGEGTIQMHLHHAHLTAVGIEVVHGLLDGLRGGAHHHHDLLRVGSAVVIEELVVPAGQLVDLIHVMLDHAGNGGDLLVGALTALEEHVRIDGGAAGGGMLRVQAVLAEGLELLLIHQLGQIVIVQRLDPLHLVRGAEAIKAVHEGVPAADGGQVSNTAQVHGLLGGGGHQHAEARHAAGHHVGVIAEDGQGVGTDGPAGHVEHAGQELAADFVHGRDHQQQTLGGRVGGGQGARLQGAVAGACGARLGLHLNDLHGFSKDVGSALGGPFVHLFRHHGGRRYGEDSRHLGERVGRVRRGGVAIHHY